MTEEEKEERDEKKKREEFKTEMKEFVKEFPDLEVEKTERDVDLGDGQIYHSLFYLINKVDGVGDIELFIRNKEHLESFRQILSMDFLLFDDFLGIRKEKEIEVYLNPINVPYRVLNIEAGETKTIFDVKLNYLKNELDIKVQINPVGSFIPILAKQIRGFRVPRSRNIVLTIKNLNNLSNEGLMLSLIHI